MSPLLFLHPRWASGMACALAATRCRPLMAGRAHGSHALGQPPSESLPVHVWPVWGTLVS